MFNFFRKKPYVSPGSHFAGPEKIIRVPKTGGVLEATDADKAAELPLPGERLEYVGTAGLKLDEVAAVLAPAESFTAWTEPSPKRPSDYLEWHEHLQDDGNHYWQVFANQVYVGFIMFSVREDKFKWTCHFPQKGSGWTKDLNQCKRSIRRRWNDFCVSAHLQPIDSDIVSPSK